MNKRFKQIVPVFIMLLLVVFTFSNAYADQVYTTLKFGNRGSKVVKLQKSLNKNGFSPGSIDGIYGKLTENAVIRFQKAKKIRIDGIAGPQTQSTLYYSTVSRGTNTSKSYSDNLYWLSRIINAEANGEPYNGKIGVGNVVLNRVNSNGFPNTVKSVIFEYYKGIPQFSPVANGTIYNDPSQESIQTAKDVLNGSNIVGTATYFFNPDKAASNWIANNKTYVKKIGNHVFYK